MKKTIGLSVGATNLTAVAVGQGAAVTRSAVLTRYPHRRPEVGVPGENRDLTTPGLILTDFVDRVGDPVGLVAADGSSHRAEAVLVDALQAMLHTVPGAERVAVSHPAHWRPQSVAVLHRALAAVPALAAAELLSDAAAAAKALAADPGLPTRGVIALCDFGGSGTSVTLLDAAEGYRPMAPTVRHGELSGALIDQALLARVLDDLPGGVEGTAAIGSLNSLRAQCRAAKERLSGATATALHVELPGRRTEVRLTRDELDGTLRAPLGEFVALLRDLLPRNGLRMDSLVAIATVGGGARIPIITTTLSEQFRVPVISSAHPELTAAIGAGLAAARGPVEDPVTAIAPMAAQALAWSVDTDTDTDSDAGTGFDTGFDAGTGTGFEAAADSVPGDPRPDIRFTDEPESEPEGVVPWYRRPAVLLALAAALALMVLAVVLVLRADEMPAPAATTTSSTTVSPTTATTTATPTSAAGEPAPPPTRTVTRQAPAPEQPAPTEQPTTEPPATEPPATEPPATEQPTTEPPAPPPVPTIPTIPPIPTIPAIPTIPGLPPFIPQPGQ